MAEDYLKPKDIEEATAKVMASVRACIGEYKAIKAADRSAKLQTLRPGEAAPANGQYYGFFDPAKLQGYEEAQKKYTAGIKATLAEVADRMERYKAQAPTEEELRAVKMLGMIKEPDAAIIDAVMNAHGKNYLASKAIGSIASDNGRHYGRHWADAAEDNLAGLARLADELAPGTVDGLTAGKLEFMESLGVIPSESSEA